MAPKRNCDEEDHHNNDDTHLQTVAKRRRDGTIDHSLLSVFVSMSVNSLRFKHLLLNFFFLFVVIVQCRFGTCSSQIGKHTISFYSLLTQVH